MEKGETNGQVACAGVPRKVLRMFQPHRQQGATRWSVEGSNHVPVLVTGRCGTPGGVCWRPKA